MPAGMLPAPELHRFADDQRLKADGPCGGGGGEAVRSRADDKQLSFYDIGVGLR